MLADRSRRGGGGGEEGIVRENEEIGRVERSRNDVLLSRTRLRHHVSGFRSGSNSYEVGWRHCAAARGRIVHRKLRLHRRLQALIIGNEVVGRRENRKAKAKAKAETDVKRNQGVSSKETVLSHTYQEENRKKQGRKDEERRGDDDDQDVGLEVVPKLHNANAMQRY